jgi:glyoxylase-like metal-dependent hydrolase (beta-lactamase superfamily II)/rhodanese-related sulfurtransferase
MLIFRQLFDATSSTYTYVLGDAQAAQAVLIDPVFDNAERDAALLRELGLHLVATLDTHVHADHVTGAWRLKQLCGSRIMLSGASGAANADRLLAHGEKVAFGHRHLEARATPGHTAGCMSFVMDDSSTAFTGDSLLIRGCGRTDFQQGSAAELYRSVHEQILSLPPGCLLYPGHDYRGFTATSVAEEKRFNPRLGGDIGVSDFIGYMSHLGLPHPRLMAIAVPANLRCGQPEGDTAQPLQPRWAALNFTFGGIWEIAPSELEERISADAASPIQIIDVREASEFSDVLGHIRGARGLPLSVLSDRLVDIDRQRPVVTVCRSGARSAQAVVLLRQAGFEQVAHLAGGMLRWRAQSLPVVQGDD